MIKINKAIIWDCHKPIPIKEDAFSGLVIRIIDNQPVLSQEVEERVNQNWERFAKNRDYAENREVAYLVSYDIKQDTRICEVFLSGYKYNQWFNRDDVQEKDTGLSNLLNFNALASWILPVCNNGKTLLFGIRRDNQFGRRVICAYGGFTKPGDYAEDRTISPYRHLKRKIKEEMGEEISTLMHNPALIGLVCSPTPMFGLKGFDLDYTIELEGTPKQLKKIIKKDKKNPQYFRELVQVEAEPSHLLKFLRYEKGTIAEKLGVLNFIGTRYGLDEMRKFLLKYDEGDFIQILKKPFRGEISDYLFYNYLV